TARRARGSPALASAPAPSDGAATFCGPMLIGAFVVGALLGGLAVWFVLRERVAAHRRAAGEVAATFRSLSGEALQQNTDSLLRLARSQLQPIAVTLKTFDEKTQALDQQRQRAYGSLTQTVGSPCPAPGRHTDRH